MRLHVCVCVCARMCVYVLITHIKRSLADMQLKQVLIWTQV
jgi:hypothetical protein